MKPRVVCIKTYAAPPIDRREILRYAGVRGDAPELAALLEESISEAEGALSYRLCYTELPITETRAGLDLGFAVTSSRDLQKTLSSCESIVLLGATVGIALDRLIARYGKVAPAKALLLQAIGAERIEALCDLFQTELAEEKRAEGKSIRPRFSPGYGDLPLTLQADILRTIDAPRRIGLSHTESMLMSPSKSVTAIIGVSHALTT